MIRKFVLVLLMVILSAGAGSAQGLNDILTVDLAEDRVDITSSFSGAHLTLFGVQEQDGNIAIVITGPKRDMVVRKKQKIFGIWTNTKGIRFPDVPAFYDFALAAPEDELASPDILKAHGIGAAGLSFVPEEGRADEKAMREFQKALVRNKQSEQLFPMKAKDIVFLNDRFFRTSFYIPANVPVGDYKIQTFLFQDGAVKDIKTTDVRVAQVGTSARIYRFAHEYSMAYGVLCVLFAMLVGWFSNAIRRRQ